MFSALVEISKLLNTGLDPESLAICVKLCEAGVNPEALASVVQELRREAASLQVHVQTCQIMSLFLPLEPGRLSLAAIRSSNKLLCCAKFKSMSLVIANCKLETM